VSQEPYVIRPKGFKGMLMNSVLKAAGASADALLIVDASGITWPDPKGNLGFTIR
jgi:hypothetical protein